MHAPCDRSVVHLTSVHQPMDTRIFLKECITLAQAGYQVTLVAPGNSHGICHGVRLEAVPSCAGRWDRMTRTVWRVYRVGKSANGDIYHLHDPELLLIGLLYRLQGKCVIYDAHEDLPKQIMSKEWIKSWLRIPMSVCARGLEWIADHAFQAIVVATPSIAKSFTHRATTIVQNFPIHSELFRMRSLDSVEPHVVYIGGISKIRGCSEVIQAMSLLPPEKKAKLVFAGVISPSSYADEVEKLHDRERVSFVGWKTRTELAELLSTATIGVVTFHPVPNHIEAQPNKLFEYMSAGIPVIASDFPLWREIVCTHQCGLVVNPTKPEEIAEAIKYLLDHPDEARAMGQRGLQAVCTHYHFENEGKRLVALYQNLCLRLKSIPDSEQKTSIDTVDGRDR